MYSKRLGGASALILAQCASNLSSSVTLINFFRSSHNSENCVIMKCCYQACNTCHQHKYRMDSKYWHHTTFICPWSINLFGMTLGFCFWRAKRKKSIVTSMALEETIHATRKPITTRSDLQLHEIQNIRFTYHDPTSHELWPWTSSYSHNAWCYVSHQCQQIHAHLSQRLPSHKATVLQVQTHLESALSQVELGLLHFWIQTLHYALAVLLPISVQIDHHLGVFWSLLLLCLAVRSSIRTTSILGYKDILQSFKYPSLSQTHLSWHHQHLLQHHKAFHSELLASEKANIMYEPKCQGAQKVIYPQSCNG